MRESVYRLRRAVHIRVEGVEAWKERSERKEHLVVRVRAMVVEEGREVAVDKEASFSKPEAAM
ncbi:hypothetical protein ODS41_09215 [Pyrobaculum sp. 3827-6]|uniref:hypothetical protein n=1 Tax=Pyrobaculum sp. 3827-6 TaxID=2983604 RepID=UPI0021DA5D23|nr:hypothetical protein [Pyrobaculum sp. 3827-6]MCU7788087.1 hypothetical protein [Pyrobaculum sp. 3827-6]